MTFEESLNLFHMEKVNFLKILDHIIGYSYLTVFILPYIMGLIFNKECLVHLRLTIGEVVIVVY